MADLVNLSAFTDVDLRDEAQMREFIDQNALTHETVFRALLESGVAIAHYPLFTDKGIDEDWLQTHGDEHRGWSVALAVPLPPDMDTVDLQDKQQAYDWLNNHALHHALVALALGL